MSKEAVVAIYEFRCAAICVVGLKKTTRMLGTVCEWWCERGTSRIRRWCAAYSTEMFGAVRLKLGLAASRFVHICQHRGL